MDYAVLQAELTNDPLNLGYAQWITAGSDTNLAGLLNAKTQTTSRRVPIGELFDTALAIGLYPSLRGAQLNPATPPQLAAVCYTLLDVINSPHLADVDLNATAATAMMDALQGAGLVSADNRAILMALASVSASRAEVLFGRGVSITPDDVALALRPPEE